MIAIGKTLVSEEIIAEHFTCDLEKCKGGCCIAGDAGAPLEEAELKLLEEVYPNVKPYLSEEGIATLEKGGKYVYDDEDKEYVTPLIVRTKAQKQKLRLSSDMNERNRSEMKECAYTIFENGIAKCGIEKAFFDGKVSFQKPVSCHLYPIRISKSKGYDTLDYNRWSVCSPACDLGKKTQIPIFEFVSTALIRKYGHDWLSELRQAAVLFRNKE